MLENNYPIQRLKIKKILMILFILLSPIFIYMSCQSMPDFLIFRTNVQGTVRLPTFYAPMDSSFLHFTCSEQTAAPDHDVLYKQTDHISLITRTTSDDSKSQNNDCNKVLVNSSNEGQIISSSYAHLTPYETSLEKLKYLVSSTPSGQALFSVVTVNDHMKIEKLQKDRNGNFLCNFKKYGYFDYKLLPYALIVLLIFFSLFQFVISDFFISAVKKTFSDNPYAMAFLMAWSTVVYLSVFPSLFAPGGDTILKAVNVNQFAYWFGTPFFIYMMLMRIIGYSWIQTLPAVTALLSQIILIKLVNYVFSNYAKKYKSIMVALSVISFPLNPIVYLYSFAQQRYFMVLSIAALGISLFFYAYIKRNITNTPIPHWQTSCILVLFDISWLVRPEYFLIFLISACGLIALNLKDKNKFGLNEAFICLALAAPSKTICSFVIPAIYQFDSQQNSVLYSTASEMPWAFQYICSNNDPNGALAKDLMPFGTHEDLCNKGAEAFFWSNIITKANATNIASLSSLSHDLKTTFLTHKSISIRGWARRAVEILHGNVYHLMDQYSLRALNQPDVIIAVPDEFGLIKEHPYLKGFQRDLTSFYKVLAYHVNSHSLVIILLLTLVGLVYARIWMTPLFSAAFLIMTVAVTFAAPAPSWAYLAFLPMWVNFCLILTILECLVAKRMKS